MTIRLSAFVLLAFTLGGTRLTLLDNGLARTPPMGWNSWNHFGCDVSEQLIEEEADAIAGSGMRDAGYQYVVIDDCWQTPATRAASSSPTARDSRTASRRSRTTCTAKD